MVVINRFGPQHSRLPPAHRATTTAAINGPKGTSGLLVGFKITNGQSAHEIRYARTK
jgi:hypothetical protein